VGREAESRRAYEEVLAALRTLPEASAPFSSWNRSILTEIYLCHAYSCQEISRVKTARQAEPALAALAHEGLALLAQVRCAAAWSCRSRYSAQLDCLPTVRWKRPWRQLHAQAARRRQGQFLTDRDRRAARMSGGCLRCAAATKLTITQQACRRGDDTDAATAAAAAALEHYEGCGEALRAALPPLHPTLGLRALEITKLCVALRRYPAAISWGTKARVTLQVVRRACLSVLLPFFVTDDSHRAPHEPAPSAVHGAPAAPRRTACMRRRGCMATRVY
jgi:hypothetical protein